MIERAVRAVVIGLVTGLVVALLIWVISAIVPGLVIDASFWGLIVGVLAALWVFVSGNEQLR